MKKNEIKTGVVYAYKRGRSDYYPPDPIVFLAAPADGKLYTQRESYSSQGPAFPPAHEGAKPQRKDGYLSKAVGYPAVLVAEQMSGRGTDDLLAVTLDEFETTGDTHRDGLQYLLVTSLTHITGTYGEAVTDHAERRVAERQACERETAERNQLRARAEAVADTLEHFGISVTPGYDLGTFEKLTLPLEQAEKLVALLGAKVTA